MPKSKRAQKITLAKTVRKGRERKEAIVEEVRGCVDRYVNLYVFETSNMRNTALKDVRARLRTSRIFFGRNKLIAAALGRKASDAYRDGLDHVADALLGGEAGIIFSDEPLEAVQQILKDSEVPEYARAGFEATEDVTLPAGDLAGFSHSMEPYLRKLGMPTKLQSGEDPAATRQKNGRFQSSAHLPLESGRVQDTLAGLSRESAARGWWSSHLLVTFEAMEAEMLRYSICDLTRPSWGPQ
eukprot:scaffold73874_cov32-Tisochrysis_lutea.AAC.1